MSRSVADPSVSSACPDCGTEIAPFRLSCPVCHRLVHAVTLKALAERAAAAEGAQNVAGALAAWREALPLLPPTAVQYSQVATRIDDLSRRVVSATAPQASGPGTGAGRRGVLATVGAAALALLGKAKFLLVGLSKAGTLLTMLLSFGVYWSLWGWPFAAGLVLSIYVHEMGHMAALRRFGVPTSAPMFLPGFGAVIRLQQKFANAGEDARVGLAGPIWGLGAAIAAAGVYEWTQQPIWAAIATTGAWINLFNLLPVWQLDGGRAFHALSRLERFVAAAVALGLFTFTHEGMLLLIGLAAGWRGFQKDAPERGDLPVLVQYATLAIALALLCLLPVPGAPARL